MALWWIVLGPRIFHKYHFSIPRNGGRAMAVQPTRSKTQRKTKVAMSLVAMAGHLNKNKQDWPMPTDPAPCGLKSHFGKNQTTVTTSAGQTPILWVSQDCIAGTNSSSLTPRRTTLRALQDLERVLITSPHKHPYQPLCPCLLHNKKKSQMALRREPPSGSQSGSERSPDWRVLGQGISRAVSW